MKNTIFIVAIFLAILSAFFFFLPKEQSETQTEVCKVVILGETYDVSGFRKQHEGGDVFVCGTDMTEQFRQQHGEDLQRLQRYLVKVE